MYVAGTLFCFLVICSLPTRILAKKETEKEKDDSKNVQPATKCEVCRLVAIELTTALEKTAKSGVVMDTGHRLDGKGNWESNKRIKYKNSEVRLIEAMEDVCEKMYSYASQSDDLTAFRYSRKRNLGALQELLDSMIGTTSRLGSLGIPTDMHSMIDPSGELGRLKSKCQSFLEDYEDDVTDWYQEHQETTDLAQFLCAEKAVKSDHSCLDQKLLDTTTEKDDEDDFDELEREVEAAAKASDAAAAAKQENMQEGEGEGEEEIEEIQAEDEHTEL